MKRLRINYDENRNCFADIRGIASDLIVGDPERIKNPWISYIIPVYKRADLLKETLESVLAQKKVRFHWDIVVVDNEAGGENDTEKLIRKINSPRILYYRNRENLGPDGNYNRCIELARGKYLAMIHGDDLIMNDHLRMMGAFIRKKEKGIKPLAYISPGYADFNNIDKIYLDRKDFRIRVKAYRGHLKRFTQTDAVITGFSVGLPSFGTIMNREVMIATGGFNENLGICEDVITPYKLMRKYRVYSTPEIMGYHRFEGNESIKPKTIFRICESMCDFREYMFSRNVLTRAWGSIARTPFYDLMVEYCSYLSGFTDHRLKKSDFAYIYPTRKPMAAYQKAIFEIVMKTYCILTGSVTYEEGIESGIKELIDDIREKNPDNKGLIIFGAGRAGKTAERILKKKYGINTDYFAVSDINHSDSSLDNIPVKDIGELTEYRDRLVLIATSVPEFFDEMKTTLTDNGFRNYIALDKRFEQQSEEA